jgi:hypothetical protein
MHSSIETLLSQPVLIITFSRPSTGKSVAQRLSAGTDTLIPTAQCGPSETHKFSSCCYSICRPKMYGLGPGMFSPSLCDQVLTADGMLPLHTVLTWFGRFDPGQIKESLHYSVS